MPALISGNCANVGAINEYGNGGFAGSADAIGACDVPLFDLIGDLGEPVADGPMIMWSCGRHKEIKHTGGFSKRQPGAEFGLDSLQFWRCSATQQGLDASGARSCRLSARAVAPPGHAHTTKAEERMDRTKSAIMNPAQAIAVVTFPILLAGLVRLKLCQLLLQTALYRLAFAQLQADVLGARSIDNPFDDCDFPTLRNAIDPDKLDPDVHPQLRSSNECPSRKGLDYQKILTPTFFPFPIAIACGPRVPSSGTFVRLPAPETVHDCRQSAARIPNTNSGHRSIRR